MSDQPKQRSEMAANDCPDCKGVGRHFYSMHAHDTCTTCHGSGQVSLERLVASLHACEGLDTVDLKGNAKGWLAGLVNDAARVERELNYALRACCAGNTDDAEPVRCQSYEASEQGQPCPRGRCVMAEEETPSSAVSRGGFAEVIAAIEKIKCDGMKSDFFKGVNDGLDRALDMLRVFDQSAPVVSSSIAESDGPKWICIGCCSVDNCHTIKYDTPGEPIDYDLECNVCGSREFEEGYHSAMHRIMDQRDRLQVEKDALSPASATKESGK